MDQSAHLPSPAPFGRRAAAFVGRSPLGDLDGSIVPPDPRAVLARSGALELRLAGTDREVRKAQRLRYRIFYEQGSAVPDPATAVARRDVCPFDAACDHLIVVDTERPDGAGATKRKVVGTYRLMRSDMAARHGGFYSATAFEIAPLLRRHPGLRFLELGRSCVHADYRGRRAIELLWQGIGI